MIMTIHAVAPCTVSSPSSASTSPPSGDAAPASLLPEPTPYAMGGDMGAEITALAIQNGQTESSLNETAQQSQDRIQDLAEQAQVSTMHDEASTMRASAWEAGLLQIAAGAATIGGGAASINGASSGVVSLIKGGADTLSGASAIAAGLGKAAETDDEALTAGSKATADAAQREADTCRQAQKDASSFISAAIDFYREYQSTKAQADAAAVHSA
jgi:hypothetical protein